MTYRTTIAIGVATALLTACGGGGSSDSVVPLPEIDSSAQVNPFEPVADDDLPVTTTDATPEPEAAPDPEPPVDSQPVTNRLLTPMDELRTLPEDEWPSTGGLDSASGRWEPLRLSTSPTENGCLPLMSEIVSDRSAAGFARDHVSSDSSVSLQSWWYAAQGYVVLFSWTTVTCETLDWRLTSRSQAALFTDSENIADSVGSSPVIIEPYMAPMPEPESEVEPIELPRVEPPTVPIAFAEQVSELLLISDGEPDVGWPSSGGFDSTNPRWYALAQSNDSIFGVCGNISGAIYDDRGSSDLRVTSSDEPWTYWYFEEGYVASLDARSGQCEARDYRFAPIELDGPVPEVQFQFVEFVERFDTPGVLMRVTNNEITGGIYNVSCDVQALNGTVVVDSAFVYFARGSTIRKGESATDDGLFLDLESFDDFETIRQECDYLRR